MSLRQRINRLARRRGGHSWIEPLGERDGIPYVAHIYEHANGQRWSLEMPARPLTVEEWVERYGAKRSEVEQ